MTADVTPTQVAQRGCGVSILGAIQNQGVVLSDVQRCLSQSAAP